MRTLPARRLKAKPAGLQERAANSGIGPHMAEGANRTVRHAQQADWEEDSFLRLNLTTLAGTVIQLQVPVSIYHTWETLEEYLVEHLPCISPIETFGCELTLLNADTQVALQDPVQEELWNTNHFCLIVHECFRRLENNKPLQGLLDHSSPPRPVGCWLYCYKPARVAVLALLTDR